MGDRYESWAIGVMTALSFTCKRVWDEGAPVLFVYHERDDVWQFLCGGDEHTSEEQAVYIHARHLFERYPDLTVVKNLALGEKATRSAAGQPWERAAIHDFGEPGDFIDKCAACGAATELRIDHIQELGATGAALTFNLELLCASCSADKNARMPEEWIGDLVERFADGAHGVAVASTSHRGTRCKIFFPADRSVSIPWGWPSALAGEVVWAERVDLQSARVLNAPFVTRDVAMFDLVRLQEANIPEDVTDPSAANRYFQYHSTMKRSWHRTFRVSFTAPTVATTNIFYTQLEQFGFSREAGGGACAIDVPVESRITDFLAAAEVTTNPEISVEILSSEPQY
jgi:hypothetical protein